MRVVRDSHESLENPPVCFPEGLGVKQVRQESNPEPTVLETAALPVELRTYKVGEAGFAPTHSRHPQSFTRKIRGDLALLLDDRARTGVTLL